MFLVVIVRKFNACRYEEYGTKITPQYLGVKGWNSGYIESLSLIFFGCQDILSLLFCLKALCTWFSFGRCYMVRKPVFSVSDTCMDPESFFRGGLTLTTCVCLGFF